MIYYQKFLLIEIFVQIDRVHNSHLLKVNHIFSSILGILSYPILNTSNMKSLYFFPKTSIDLKSKPSEFVFN